MIQRRRIVPRRRAILSARRRRAAGAVLPVVLLISAMMLTSSAAWFESAVASARGSNNVRDYLQAFHAADAALTLCERSVVAGVATIVPVVMGQSGEPTGWKLESSFDAGAFAPTAQWPGSLRAPQCLVETWRLAERPDARAYLLTARGFGGARESQVWLQLQIVGDAELTERHWRRVVARPF